MRHYFRFMELEPVLEMEEDSVGDESPTSSTGSPSFSPPPDVWGQLTGKEYHDSVYNLLLQDHLELQRAYRVLEVQYRNCEKRAGRDAAESAAQVRALKDTLKEVLTTQESDRMLAIKEDLQRVRERESKLKEEAYDLREQNELLEFRILELEECQENSSRSGGYDTCDTATDTGDDDVTGTPLDGTHGEQVIADASTLVTPDSTLTIRKEPGDVTPHIGEVTCHQATLHNNDDKNMCQQTLESNMASPPGDLQCCTVTAQSAINLEQSTPHTHHNDYRDQMSAAECSSGVVTTCPPDVSASPPISCTLCRRLPRRKSLTETATDVSGELQREPLRKCKSDGEIKKWNRCRDLEFRDDVEFEVANCSEHAEIVNLSNKHKSKSRNVESSLVSRSPNNHIDGMPFNSSEVTHSCDSSSASDRSTSNEDDQSVLRDMLKSIWDVLKETRIEVECTNSELREEVVTLENTVVCLMGEPTASQDLEEDETKDSAPGNLRELFQRHNSLTSSKECHCCSEVMRPAIEDVICKLQLLTDMVDSASLKPITTSRTPCGEAKTVEAWDNSAVTDDITEALKTPRVEIPETHVVRTEVQIRKSISDEGENKLMSSVTEDDERNNIVDNSVVNEDEHTVIEYKDNITIVRNIVEKKREYFKSSKAVFEMDNLTEYHASALHPKVEETYNVGDAERPNKEFNNNILIEVPLSGDKVTPTDRLIYQLEYYHSTDI